MNKKLWAPVFAQIDLKNAMLYIRDGTTPTAEEIEIKIGEGNLTFSEKINREYTLNRGTLDEVRNGDEVPMDVSFDILWDYIKGSSTTGEDPSVEDALKQRGNAAAWESTDSDTCRPYAVDIVIVYTPSPSACGDSETITFPDFRYESLDHDLRGGTASCSGKCNATEPTVVRAAQ